MKRILVVLLVLVMFTPTVLRAEDKQNTKSQASMGMMQGNMMMGNWGSSCMMGMMAKTMVPTNDGGVIVLNGDKLIKYDGNLNQQKEVTIPSNTAYMNNMMNMMQNCPWMGGQQDTRRNDNSQ